MEVKDSILLVGCNNPTGAVGGKTGKTLVLPQFSKIERGGSVMVVLPYLAAACALQQWRC